MQKWEHSLMVLDKPWFENYSKQVEAVNEKMGNEGWELVSVVSVERRGMWGGTYAFHLWFKQPVEDPA